MKRPPRLFTGTTDRTQCRTLAELSTAERQAFREQLLDDTQPLPTGISFDFRSRWLRALDVVEMLSEPEVTVGAIEQAQAVVTQAARR
jgi:hypothetical protein